MDAQSQWDAKNFGEALATAEEANAIDPDTIEITDGLNTMRANYTRVQRSRNFIAEAVSLHGEQDLEEALRHYRRAYAAWPLVETGTSIRALEMEIDQIRVRMQRAEWLRDTAVAFDQENRFADALRYYRETLALQFDEAVSQRADRIEMRLASIAQATDLITEGRDLEARGLFQEAIERYRESLTFEPSQTLELHVSELEETIRARMSQAAILRTEATQLQNNNNDAEALLRFRESHALWPNPELEVIIASLEQTVTETAQVAPRTPEDFGIGTQADAARLLQEGHALYMDGRYREALDIYRKSYAISNDPRLANWISSIETTLNELDAIHQANALVRAANDLYIAGDHLGALEKYRESLTIHHNAEVENFINLLLQEITPAGETASIGG